MSIINKPSDYMNTKLYTGNGSAGNSITGLDFQPDWVWIKDRDNVRNHVLNDAVRGATKNLFSNTNGTESTDTSTLTAFNSDGFTLGNGTKVNGNNINFVSWNWKAGTSFTNDASATGIGTIDSSGSVNDTAGFSIVSYTGTGNAGTIKHGLTSVPSMIIFKNTGSAVDWRVYHKALGNTHRLCLNDTSVSTNDDSAFNDTSPTSTLFTVGGSSSTNPSSGTMIAYCFAEKQGYSKFGSYLGINGGENGPFIHTDFKVGFVLIKDSSATNAWTIRDDKRNTFNPATNFLMPDATDAEVTAGEAVDILSNGFKIKANGGKVQDSGNTYIYMAFAENPFVTSTDNGSIPACAR